MYSVDAKHIVLVTGVHEEIGVGARIDAGLEE
jgi:hypothetical protein